MLVFRLVFFSSLAYALSWSLQMRNRRTRPGNQMRLAIGAFLGFVIGYSAAPVVGFAYQRHTMPLILPTLAVAAVVTHLSRWQTQEGVTG